MRNDGVPHPDYPSMGLRAKDGDTVIREDWPTEPPRYADGTPIQVYDRVRVLHQQGDYLAGVRVVTEIRVRSWGHPGRYQQWGGNDPETGGTRWYDRNEEQVWIGVDDRNAILQASDLVRVEGDES